MSSSSVRMNYQSRAPRRALTGVTNLLNMNKA